MPLLELAAREVAASIPFELVENYQVQNEPVPVLEIVREYSKRVLREFRENSKRIPKEFQENSKRIPREFQGIQNFNSEDV